MKNPVVRSVLALLAGIVVANLLILLIENASTLFVELPPELRADAATLADPERREAFMQAWADYMPNAPLTLLLFPPLAWLIGSGAGAWVAARLAPGTGLRQALIVGALILIGSLLNLYQIPHPSWMWLVGPLAPILGTYLGARWAGAFSPPAAESPA